MSIKFNSFLGLTFSFPTVSKNLATFCIIVPLYTTHTHTHTDIPGGWCDLLIPSPPVRPQTWSTQTGQAGKTSQTETLLVHVVEINLASWISNQSSSDCVNNSLLPLFTLISCHYLFVVWICHVKTHTISRPLLTVRSCASKQSVISSVYCIEPHLLNSVFVWLELK